MTASYCRTAILSSTLGLVLVAPACAQTQKSAPAASPTTASPAPSAATKSARQVLDEQYVMGPTAVDEFGYRIAWQTEPLATKNSTAEITNPAADSIWFADAAGSVVRVRRDNGETVWRASTFKGLERIFAIEHLPIGHDDRVYILTHIDSIVLDALSGTLVKRSRLAHLPTATPSVYGPYFVYGTRSGLINWYQYGTGFAWRATTIGGTIRTAPTVAGDVLLCGSTNGKILALDAGSTQILWDRHLSAGIESRIAADKTACFVSSKDQSLWAFDLSRGRVLWHYFTQSPLTNDPTRLADGLYLQIPDEGLVSFNPYPVDRPEGEVLWKSKASGNVIGRLGSNLIVWDAPAKKLTFVDAGNGRIVTQRELPQVQQIQCFPQVNGDLYLTAVDGRIERAEPLARAHVPAETDANSAADAANAAKPAAGNAPAPEPTTVPANPPAKPAENAPGDTPPGATSPQPKFSPRLR